MAEPLIEFEPELAVEAETTVEGLSQIGVIAIVLIALGFILAVDAICRAFFGTVSGAVGWIPYAGKVLSQPIDAIKKKVVSFLSGLEHDLDSSMGRHLHLLRQDVHQFIYSLEEMAVGLIIIGGLIAGATATYVIGPLKTWIHSVIRKVEEEIRTLEREVIRQGAHVERITVNNIFPRIAGATVKVERFVEHAIQPIEQTAKDAERTAVRAEKNVRRLERHLGSKAFLAALTGAIGTLAVDALQCTQFGNLFKNKGCSLWKMLEDLLGIFAGLFAFTVFCDFWGSIEPFIGDILAPVIALSATFADGICSHPPDTWAVFTVDPGTTPPPNVMGTRPH